MQRNHRFCTYEPSRTLIHDADRWFKLIWTTFAVMAMFTAAQPIGVRDNMVRGATRDPISGKVKLSVALLATWGLYQILVGFYFIFIRPSFLPEDLQASAVTLEAIRRVAPGIETWLQWVFAVLGGQMAATGVVVLGGAFRIASGDRVGRIEAITYLLAGFLSVVMMSVVNFALRSDFRWLLVAPVVLWLSAAALLAQRAFHRSE